VAGIISSCWADTSSKTADSKAAGTFSIKELQQNYQGVAAEKTGRIRGHTLHQPIKNEFW